MVRSVPDLLDGLAQADAQDVLALGVPVTLRGGDVLFRLGDEAASLYIVQRGCIALRLPMDVAGRASDVVVEERGVGQTVGWSGLIPPHRFTLEAIALVDAVVLGLPRATLMEHFSRHPDVGWEVTQNLASIIGQRLQVIQAMWLREMQRVVALRYA
jgi:CRP-like cAMP-binding protein